MQQLPSVYWSGEKSVQGARSVKNWIVEAAIVELQSRKDSSHCDSWYSSV